MACFACASWARAAEWSFAPTATWSVDHDSNRFFLPSAIAVPGEGAFLTLNALLTRTTDLLQLALQPYASLQRFDTGSGQFYNSYSNNASINMSAAWSLERSTLALTGGYSDLSTLLTELGGSGVVQGNTHQEQSTAGATWALHQSANTQLNAQLGYADVRYVGAETFGLNSYQYPSVSLSEQYNFTARTSMALIASGSEVRSPGGPGTARDAGLSVSATRAFSETFTAFVSAGYSEIRYDVGNDHGVVGEFRLTETGELTQWKLSYQRSVAPNGYGTLAVHDQASLSATRSLTPHLSATASLLGTRDNFNLVLQGERTSYESFETSLNWRSGETSTITLTAGYDRSKIETVGALPSASRWRAALAYTWSVKPHGISR